jgi:hypothetical protein
MNEYLFTSESVTDGHPDKICDQIADSILDAALSQDPTSKMAVEATIKDDFILVYGEANTKAVIDYATTVFVLVDGKLKVSWKKIASIALSVFLAIAAGADLLAGVGLVFQIPYVGMVLTGIFFSRGSNYVADLLTLLANAKLKIVKT